MNSRSPVYEMLRHICQALKTGGRLVIAEPYELRGRYLNLFDPELSLLTMVTIAPGTRMLLLDLDRIHEDRPKVVAAACRVRGEKSEGGRLEFQVDGIAGTSAIVGIGTRSAPTEIAVAGRMLEATSFDFSHGVLRLRFVNSPEPTRIEVQFRKVGHIP